MTARQKLLESNTYRDVAAVLSSEHFERAAETAMLVMVENLPLGVSECVSGNNLYQQIIGAKRFLSIMQGLIRTGEEPTVPRRDTLNPTK